MERIMTVCPDCGHKSLVGADTCEACQQPLRPRRVAAFVPDIERNLREDPIRTLRPNRPMTARPETPVGDVLKLLVEKTIGCVLVVDRDDVVGVFSERDALMRLGVDTARLADRPVSEFMTPSPVALDESDKIVFALHKMDLGGYRHVPIFTQGKLTGVISIRDILRYLRERIGLEAMAPR